MSRILNLNDYKGADDRTRIQNALDDAAQVPGSTLILPPGEYVISTPLARKTMQECLSGEYGENPENTMFQPTYDFSVGLSLAGHHGTTVLGYGAVLMIDGFMEPISIDHCEDVKLCGVTIDYLRKPYSRGEIEQYDVTDPVNRTGSIVVRFNDGFPMNEYIPTPRYDVYDFRTSRFLLDMKSTGKEWLGENRIRFFMTRMPDDDLTRQEFYVWHSFHYRPAILIEEAARIVLRDVSIHSQPGMGIVGHRSRDVLLERVHVVPSHGEHMSVNTDATHFTSCRGDLIYRDCTFEGHGDDVTNVHTFYHDIHWMDGSCYEGGVGVRTHSLTLDYPDVGDTLELVERDSLLVKKTYKVVSVEPDFVRQVYQAVLDTALPEDAPGCCWLLNRDQVPYLQFMGCTTRNHWARAVLIKARKAKVEKNVFMTSALQAIHVAAEGWWHEGGPCEELVISGNRFVHTGLLQRSNAGGICIEMSCELPKGTPQKNILIEDNVFEMEQVQHAITVRNAENVVIRNNRFTGCEKPVDVENCRRVIM